MVDDQSMVAPVVDPTAGRWVTLVGIAAHVTTTRFYSWREVIVLLDMVVVVKVLQVVLREGGYLRLNCVLFDNRRNLSELRGENN